MRLGARTSSEEVVGAKTSSEEVVGAKTSSEEANKEPRHARLSQVLSLLRLMSCMRGGGEGRRDVSFRGTLASANRASFAHSGKRDSGARQDTCDITLDSLTLDSLTLDSLTLDSVTVSQDTPSH